MWARGAGREDPLKFRKGVTFVFKQGTLQIFLSGDPTDFEQG